MMRARMPVTNDNASSRPPTSAPMRLEPSARDLSSHFAKDRMKMSPAKNTGAVRNALAANSLVAPVNALNQSSGTNASPARVSASPAMITACGMRGQRPSVVHPPAVARVLTGRIVVGVEILLGSKERTARPVADVAWHHLALRVHHASAWREVRTGGAIRRREVRNALGERERVRRRGNIKQGVAAVGRIVG